MKNWSVDEQKLKEHPGDYKKWRLEQIVNYGLDGERLSREELKKLFFEITIIDPYRRKFLEWILWGKKS